MKNESTDGIVGKKVTRHAYDESPPVNNSEQINTAIEVVKAAFPVNSPEKHGKIKQVRTMLANVPHGFEINPRTSATQKGQRFTAISISTSMTPSESVVQSLKVAGWKRATNHSWVILLKPFNS